MHNSPTNSFPAVSGAAGPNHSLNRTLHSGTVFGPPFHSGPNTVPLFRAG